jgi:hypothetical protein
MPSEVAIKTGSQYLLQHAGTQFVPRTHPLAPSRTTRSGTKPSFHESPERFRISATPWNAYQMIAKVQRGLLNKRPR